jgi:hypothetical protein
MAKECGPLPRRSHSRCAKVSLVFALSSPWGRSVHKTPFDSNRSRGVLTFGRRDRLGLRFFYRAEVERCVNSVSSSREHGGVGFGPIWHAARERAGLWTGFVADANTSGSIVKT